METDVSSTAKTFRKSHDWRMSSFWWHRTIDDTNNFDKSYLLCLCSLVPWFICSHFEFFSHFTSKSLEFRSMIFFKKSLVCYGQTCWVHLFTSRVQFKLCTNSRRAVNLLSNWLQDTFRFVFYVKSGANCKSGNTIGIMYGL